MSGHRCAVCWERQTAHAQWIEHVVDEHGADVADWDPCRGRPGPRGGLACIGIEHAARLNGERLRPVVRRAQPEPQPFRARDGTTYIQQRLLP